MNFGKRTAFASCAGAFLACCAISGSLPASAQGKDDLWEVSTKMEMPL